MKKIGLQDVKVALKDGRFRDSLPKTLESDLIKYLQNPGCPCNVPFYRKLLKEASESLLAYFQGGEIVDEQEEIRKLAENQWQVFNCHIDELEGKLRSLPPGRKQIELSRYEDQVTCIVNELDLIF